MSDQLRGAALHEAGHAIVARAFGLTIITIEIGIGGDDAKGEVKTSSEHHLPRIDRLTIYAAGVEAQELFECPTNYQAGADDFGKMIELLEELETEAEREGCCKAAHIRARDILQMQSKEVVRLAEHLIKHRKIDGPQFF
jgi:hypothetical protein